MMRLLRTVRRAFAGRWLFPGRVYDCPVRPPQSRKASGYCLLFPGQGSQYVGMGKNLIAAAESGALPGVAQLFQLAERVLGYDLYSLFLQGPEEKLEETVHCQPAVVVASLAGLEKIKQDNPEFLLECKAAAGFSVGEITALVAAQSLSMEEGGVLDTTFYSGSGKALHTVGDLTSVPIEGNQKFGTCFFAHTLFFNTEHVPWTGLHLVKTRADAMQKACLQTPSSMLTVIGLKEEPLTAILHAVKNSHLDSELCIGNRLFPIGFVVSGNTEQVMEVGRQAKMSGAVVKLVRVSGAFHSKLMQPAVPQLEAVLRDIDIRVPIMPVYSNVTGLPYKSVDDVRTGLALQVTSPVLWSATISHMASCKFRTAEIDMKFLEIGPGQQLRTMLKGIDRTAFRQSESFIV